MCLSVLREEFRLVQFRLQHPNSADFAESPWFGVLTVLLYRFAIAAFCTGAIIWSGLYYPGTNIKWFVYLSNWSFFFVTLYFIGATIVTAIHYKSQHKQKENTAADQNENKKGLKMAGSEGHKETNSDTSRNGLVTSHIDSHTEVAVVVDASGGTPMSWPYAALWVIYNIASVAAFVVTLSFWSLIYRTFGGGAGPISVIVHAVNSIVMVCDTMLSSIPVRLFHVVYPMLYSIAYIGFTVIYWACGGKIYPQTDYTGRPVLAAVSLVCLFFIGLPLCQSMLFGFYRLRVWIKTEFA